MSRSSPKWLKDYYGKFFEDLNPSVVVDGNKKAIVRLSKVTPKGYSNSAYVLVTKFGRHNVSKHLALFDGNPTAQDLVKMKNILAKEDS